MKNVTIGIRWKGGVLVGWLCLAGTATADDGASPSRTSSQEEETVAPGVGSPEGRRWNASFLFGSTKFNDSEAHQTLGAALRIRLTNRLSVEPEVRYMSVPDSSSEWAGGRRARKHSDVRVGARVVYDFREETRTRVVPYVTGGAGWVQTRNESTSSTRPIEGAVAVFRAPPPLSSTTNRDVSDWLWMGGSFGVRILRPHGLFVSPEVGLGGSRFGDLTALENFARVALRSPSLLPRLFELPRRVRRLTEGKTFLDTHRVVQGERFLGASAARA